jgi:hypothetical protein
VSAEDGVVCVTLARTSQGYYELKEAARGGHTACVEALIAAKADQDRQEVSYARLFMLVFLLLTIKSMV